MKFKFPLIFNQLFREIKAKLTLHKWVSGTSSSMSVSSEAVRNKLSTISFSEEDTLHNGQITTTSSAMGQPSSSTVNDSADFFSFLAAWSLSWKHSSHAEWRHVSNFGDFEAQRVKQKMQTVSWPTIGFLPKKIV